MEILKTNNEAYRCIQCGAEEISVIREDPKKQNHRLKCGGCGFLFSVENAQNAEKAGAIPASSPESLANAADPETEIHTPSEQAARSVRTFPSEPQGVKPKEIAVFANKIPRTPTYVFVSKDRTQAEFCNSKEVKKLAMKWEQRGKYDVFELNPKQFDVKVDIS